MHNRQPITPKLLFKSLCDFDLWPLYILGLMFQTPMTTPSQYLTLTLRGMGFNTFVTNLLTIPTKVLSIILMLALTYVAEVVGELTLVSMFGQIWALPFVIYLYVKDIDSINHWTAWVIMTLFLAYPSGEFFFGTVSASDTDSTSTPDPGRLELTQFQHRPLSNCLGSNVQHVCPSIGDYRIQYLQIRYGCCCPFHLSSPRLTEYSVDDAPRYKRGNRVLVGLVSTNIVLYLLTKAYYAWRNASREKKWQALSQEEKLHYISTTTDEGSHRLDFRFAH